MRDPAALRSKDGASALIHQVGAQAGSWIPAGGAEQLFTATNAAAGIGAFMGGVPICFPQFGGGPLPQHGFARDQVWTAAGRGEDDDGAWVAYRLTSAGELAGRWPHAFSVEVVIKVGGPRLSVTLDVENTGGRAWYFTGALHTYFLVDDIDHVTLDGLGGRHYRDKTRGGEAAVQAEPQLRLSSETDRVYLGAPSPLHLRDGKHALRIAAQGFPDVVVWNPWAGAQKRWPEFGPDDFRRMICVEAAVALDPVSLERGQRWTGSQTLTVE